MLLKPKYYHHSHSVSLLAYHFVTTNKRRKPELEGITLDLFRKAVSKYSIEIHVGEVMADTYIYLYRHL